MEEEVEPTLEELQDRRQTLRDLVRSPAWKEYKQILEGQIQTRLAQDKAMDLVREESALAKLIELRAERRMLQLALDLPEAIINDLTIDIEEETDAPGNTASD